MFEIVNILLRIFIWNSEVNGAIYHIKNVNTLLIRILLKNTACKCLQAVEIYLHDKLLHYRLTIISY